MVVLLYYPLSLALWNSSCLMPLAWGPAVLSGGDPCSSVCPGMLFLKELCLSKDLGFCSLFYLGCFALHSGIACLGYVHSGIACLASKASDWAIAFWDGLSGCDWLPFLRCPCKHIYCNTDHDWLLL